MMINYLKILVCFCLVGVFTPTLGQIVFFEGDFKAALEKAETENKKVFVDFYTTWCGPCKAMATQVFPREEVGTYFNDRFVCCKIDAETRKDLAKLYKIDAYPNMVFMDAQGKLLRRVTGTVDAETLIHEAKVAYGEALSFEQLYEKYKKNKQDLEVVQELLLQAPDFVKMQKEYEQQKWVARVELLFSEYIKNKGLENMINSRDFEILTSYHLQVEKNDPIFDFIVAHFGEYTRSIEERIVSQYVVGLNNACIMEMCRKGDREGYLKRLELLDGNMKVAYGHLKFGTLSVKEALTLLADGSYYLHKGDEKQYFECTDRYLAARGEDIVTEDYMQFVEDLYMQSQGKLSPKARQKCIMWITAALQTEMPVQERSRLLIMQGECYKWEGDTGKAKQSYNQAFLTTAQIENEMMRMQLQKIIKQHLQEL